MVTGTGEWWARLTAWPRESRRTRRWGV